MTPLEASLEILFPILSASDPAEQRIAAKCIGLIGGYAERWKNADYDVLEVEHVLSADLINPETNVKSRSYRMAGKLDVICRDTAGRIVVIDHKTTSEEVADFDAPYWRQLVIEGQVTHYMLLQWLNGEKVDYAVWDVMRKPGIAPKIITKKEREAAYMTKEYCGSKLNTEELEKLAASERETSFMYSARVLEDCTHIRPEHYFQRRTVPRMDSEILEYAKELWQHSQDMLWSKRNQSFPRNSGACMLYKTPCKFLGICSGHDNAESGNWTNRAGWPHPELPQMSGDVLTNSRIRTFQTCRRKEYLQYQLGLVRIDEEEREALRFGTLWHQALEAFFRNLKGKSNGYHSTDSSVIAVE